MVNNSIKPPPNRLLLLLLDVVERCRRSWRGEV